MNGNANLNANNLTPQNVIEWRKKLGEVPLKEVTASADTLPPNSQATVVVTDTPTSTNLAFGIPKGDKGDTGETGPTGPTGPKGDTGATGPTGEVGPQGPKGDKGDKGDTGKTPEITATATTLPAGWNVQVTRSGTIDSPNFNFAIPRGDKGETGDTGPQGPKGETGPIGPAGPKGDTGPQGQQGEKGEKGDTGITPIITITVDTLPAGSSATVTKTGSNETPNFNFGIPRGDKGEKGDTGPQGPKGESGLLYQTTGQNTDGAMSQKATTDELAKKAGKDNRNHFTQKNTFEQGFYINNNVSSGIYTDFYPSGSGTLSINLRKIENGTDSPLSSFSFGEGGLYFYPTGSTAGSAFITYESFINNLKSKIYPVGSIYMSVNNTSPASFLGGTWTALDEGYTLWTTKTSGQGGAKISAGLPNITGELAAQINQTATANGCFTPITGEVLIGSSWGQNSRQRTKFDASKSNSIYGKSRTVQPPAIKVYMWERVS